MTKTKTDSGPVIQNYVPDAEMDGDELLPIMPVADATGRNLIFWGVKWVKDRAFKQDAPKETWLVEVSENGDDAPTHVTFINQTALVSGLQRMGEFPRRVQIAPPDSTRKYYRFIAPSD